MSKECLDSMVDATRREVDIGATDAQWDLEIALVWVWGLKLKKDTAGIFQQIRSLQSSTGSTAYLAYNHRPILLYAPMSPGRLKVGQ